MNRRQVYAVKRPLIHCESFGGRGSRGLRKNAKVEGYAIGGKTATSQTLPRSDNVYIASFLGFYPVDDPALMVLVKINNPKGGAYYGGTIAAPVAAEIFREIIPYAQEIGVCN